MFKDKNGNECKVGDVLFYSERPHSNYADSLVQIYEKDGVAYVGTLVVHGFTHGFYESYGFHKNDLTAEDSFLHGSEWKTLIPGLTADQCTPEYAHEHYPLDK